MKTYIELNPVDRPVDRFGRPESGRLARGHPVNMTKITESLEIEIFIKSPFREKRTKHVDSVSLTSVLKNF